MTNEQLGAFILANAAAIFAVLKWGTIRAIKYTHLERDVKEEQKATELQAEFNKQVLNDLKGLSIKIDRLKNG